jgi:uncharacterized protein (DUF488 family)
VTLLFTIGHSTLPIDSFVGRLCAAEIHGVADVRRFPTSTRYPHFNKNSLSRSLAESGIEYRWFEALGGRRKSPLGDRSPNQGLRVGGFRGYADYALTSEFREALRELLDWSSQLRVAICCAEGFWWRCHRRIIADHVLARGIDVIHIMPGGGTVPHRLWELARLTPEGPIYPAPGAGHWITEPVVGRAGRARQRGLQSSDAPLRTTDFPEEADTCV